MSNFTAFFVSHTAPAPEVMPTHGPTFEDGRIFTASTMRAETFRPEPTPAQVAAPWGERDEWSNC